MQPGAFRNFIAAMVLVVLAIAALAYFFAGASDPSSLSFDRSGPRMAALGAILAVLLISLFFSRPRLREVMHSALVWGGLGLVLVLGYSYKGDFAGLGDRLVAVLVPGTAVDQTDGSVVVIRDGTQHYRVKAAINGAPATFLVDTGASAVTLTADDARAAGYDLDSLSFTIPVSTANGRTFVAPVRIETLDIGSIRLSDIRAYVSRNGALETSLLGLTALDKLSSWRVEGSKLILNP
ncbi:TIGR02281 family clan AA aspartic protease [Stappia sp. F7233]|uniref:TIGR02281 family clan AA aspartic protease n=1 Tax=Stappia albiluteola TaxID=2758565 RepID=A0A839AD61_9HYPH|nr:TIGR02281 family clan AA aspartic protease [Stappia albiluteola]MBA5776589.1 TIGR02281 family clan AA aspartic protease [Stappia albiluteola]